MTTTTLVVLPCTHPPTGRADDSYGEPAGDTITLCFAKEPS